MKTSSHVAFTLVELIVVITILAILGTIGFLSFSGYSRDARNSARVNDMKAIQKNLDLDIVTFSSIPLPDGNTVISYSGGTAWNQGYFGETARAESKRVSDIPLDPVFGTPYTYSVKTNRKYYQLSSILEGGSLFGNIESPLGETYALSNNDFQAFNIGNFTDPDIVVKNGSDCYIIAAPSIVLSDIPTGGVLENNTPYNYSYTNSPHISSSYSGSIENTNIAAGFQNIEVYSGCTINTLEDLQLYNAKLSTAYQQFGNESKYETLIFNSKSREFLLASMESLEDRGMTISKAVSDQLRNPGIIQIFTESFTDLDGTQLVGSHVADSGGLWYTIPGGDSSSYSILGNELVKNNATNTKIYPRPNPDITKSDYTVTLNINDFSGGAVSIYLRYVDNDNYYRVELSSSGYIVYRNQAGIEVQASNVSETINPGSEIIFGIEGDSLALSIAGSPKGNIVLGGIDGIGYPVLWMENSGARIDNYSLTYK